MAGNVDAVAQTVSRAETATQAGHGLDSLFYHGGVEASSSVLPRQRWTQHDAVPLLYHGGVEASSNVFSRQRWIQHDDCPLICHVLSSDVAHLGVATRCAYQQESEPALDR